MSDLSTSSGIYQITCTGNGKIYVGSAINIRRRWTGHRTDLERGEHDNPYLQRAWNKYGPDSFYFSVLEFVSPDELISREQAWIDKTRCCDRAVGFNMSPTAGSVLGIQRSAETRAKISAFHKGRVASAETRAKIGAASRARLSSTSARAALSARTKAQLADPEVRARMSAAQKVVMADPERRARQSIIMRAKGPGMRAIAQALWEDPEFRAKTSATIKTALAAPETRERLSATAKAQWARPDVRQKMLTGLSASQRKRYENPEERERSRARSTAQFASPEARAKLSAQVKERMADPEVRAKISAARAKSYPGFVAPDGTIYRDITNLLTFCKEHGLDPTNMWRVAVGKAMSYRGWIALLPDGSIPDVEARYAEANAKRGVAQKGKPKSQEHNQKVSDAKSHVYAGFVAPDGTVYRNVTNLRVFCEQHGLTINKMYKVATGRAKSHKGWTALPD